MALAAVLFIPLLATAGVDVDNKPTLGGKGVLTEIGSAGAPATLGTGGGVSFVGVVLFFESDDSAAYGGPTGATIDTGDEVCAVHGMTCADVVTFAEAGGSGDEFTASACDTDIADGGLGMAFCY